MGVFVYRLGKENLQGERGGREKKGGDFWALEGEGRGRRGLFAFAGKKGKVRKGEKRGEGRSRGRGAWRVFKEKKKGLGNHFWEGKGREAALVGSFL